MWLIFSFLLIASGLFAEMERIYIPREDGSFVEGYLSAPENLESFPVVIFVDGSSEVSVSISHGKLAPRFNPINMGFLSLEKRGISEEGMDKDEFLQHDCFEERLQDYVLLMHSIENGEIPGCNGNCVVMGASEGGKIAPLLSGTFPALVKGLVLIGSGGGLPFAEETKYQSQQLINQMSALKRMAYKARGMIQSPYEFYEKMMASPDSLEMCGPKTWKWWASYLSYDPLPDLLNVDAPIYMIHGEADIMVPIQSADLVKDAFERAEKENFILARYGDLGHALTGREDVYESLIEWVKSVSF